MRIFKYRLFHQWAKHEELSDEALKTAIDEIEKGLFDANLGSGLYKKRVARKGQGKRGSYRTLLAFKQGDKTFFKLSLCTVLRKTSVKILALKKKRFIKN